MKLLEGMGASRACHFDWILETRIYESHLSYPTPNFIDWMDEFLARSGCNGSTSWLNFFFFRLVQDCDSCLLQGVKLILVSDCYLGFEREVSLEGLWPQQLEEQRRPDYILNSRDTPHPGSYPVPLTQTSTLWGGLPICRVLKSSIQQVHSLYRCMIFLSIHWIFYVSFIARSWDRTGRWTRIQSVTEGDTHLMLYHDPTHGRENDLILLFDVAL